MLNPEVLGKYFDTLESVVAANNLLDKSQYIWNCDESGFNREHNPVKIYAEKGEKSVVSRTSNKSSNITLMACVNGAGDRMSTMFITKSKTKRSLIGFNTLGVPDILSGRFNRMDG